MKNTKKTEDMNSKGNRESAKESLAHEEEQNPIVELEALCRKQLTTAEEQNSYYELNALCQKRFSKGISTTARVDPHASLLYRVIVTITLPNDMHFQDRGIDQRLARQRAARNALTFLKMNK